MKTKELLVNVDCLHCQAKISGLHPAGLEVPTDFLLCYPPPEHDLTLLGHCSKHLFTKQEGRLFHSLCSVSEKPTKDCYAAQGLL